MPQVLCQTYGGVGRGEQVKTILAIIGAIVAVWIMDRLDIDEVWAGVVVGIVALVALAIYSVIGG